MIDFKAQPACMTAIASFLNGFHGKGNGSKGELYAYDHDGVLAHSIDSTCVDCPLKRHGARIYPFGSDKCTIQRRLQLIVSSHQARKNKEQVAHGKRATKIIEASEVFNGYETVIRLSGCR